MYTTSSLGSKGVRDMAHELADRVVASAIQPIWVPDLYRAITDFALMDMEFGNCPPKPMLV